MDFIKTITVMMLLALYGCGGGGGGGGGSTPPATTAPPGAYSAADAETTQISCPSEPVEKTVQVPQANLSFYEKLVLSEDGEIEVYTTRSQFDTFCNLRDQQFGIIASDDESGTEDNCKITRSLRKDITYYVQVRAYDNQATGSFALGTRCLGPYQESTAPQDPVGGDDPGALGDLAFTLVWSHSGSTQEAGPDIDMWVINPIGERLSTSRDGLALGTPDSFGGIIDKDDRGGWFVEGSGELEEGTGEGPERAFWPDKPPAGTYRFGVRYFEGNGTAEYTLRVYRSGTISTHIGTLTEEGGPIEILPPVTYTPDP